MDIFSFLRTMQMDLTLDPVSLQEEVIQQVADVDAGSGYVKPPWHGTYAHVDLDSGYQEYDDNISGASIFDVARAVVNPAAALVGAAFQAHYWRFMPEEMPQ